MALPILDGNQSPTTLSTIIVSNAHVPAHTVTSFGAQAITDIATAVSGVELGPNTLNALENITVTLGQVTITGGLTDAQLRASPVTIGGNVTATISGTPSITFGTAVITGSTSILNFPATQTVTFTQIATHGVTIAAGTAQIGSVTASISGTVPVSGTFYQATQPVSIASLPALAAGAAQIGSVTASISGTPSVTFGAITGSINILGTPSITFGVISGTVTANSYKGQFIYATVVGIFSGTFILERVSQTEWYDSDATVRLYQEDGLWKVRSENEDDFIATHQQATVLPPKTGWTIEVNYSSFSISYEQPFVQPISGTVTANVVGLDSANGVTASLPLTVCNNGIGSSDTAVAVIIASENGGINQFNPLPISGTVTVGNSVTIGSLPNVAGTVTANGGNFTGVQLQAQPPERAIQLGYYDTDNSEFVLVNQSGIPIQAINPLTIQGLDNGKVTISGTVTANLARPTWTDYSGTITTAGTAVTAVSTITRSYLLAQVTTGQMFLNIGATATTLNSVYFSAGQGFAWETSVPQGIVSIISSVTGTNYVLKAG